MHQYRAYILDQGGYITSAIDLFCQDDHEARAQASELADGPEVELWQRDRFIDRFGSAHKTGGTYSGLVEPGGK